MADSNPASGTDSSAANSPATSQANLNQMISQSLGLAVQNAVVAQQQGTILHQAATSVGITQLYSIAQGTNADQNLQNLTKTLEQLQKVAEIFKNQGSSQPSSTPAPKP
jgi:hypothetical protein